VRLPSSTKLRRYTQIAFFILFVFLLLRTEFHGSLHTTQAEITPPFPVRLFFLIDPLVALSNALATHGLYHGLLWSLLVLIPTMFFGRFFCGWVCPLGSMNHFFSGLRSEQKLGKKGIEANRYKRWQMWKYYLLLAVLAAAAFGTGIVGWLDPFSLLVRSLGLSALPGLNYALAAALGWMEHSRFGAVQFLGSGLHFVFGGWLVSFRQPRFEQGIWLGLIFLVVMLANFRVTRFFCRALCPLGALLGLASRWSVLRLVKAPVHCKDCNRCLLHCQGGDDPIGGVPWRPSECHLCLNCIGECPEHSLKFQLFATQEAKPASLERRKVLMGLAAGAAIIPIVRATPGFEVKRPEGLLRPPGAVDEEFFTARCIRCGECMKVCPTNALHPAGGEAGLEGLWTPVLKARIGYCETSCTMCSQVCPTGAIWRLTPSEKGWSAPIAGDAKPVRIGTAFYDRGRCLPWAMATECIVCEEWCPTSPKAIYLRPAEVVTAEGVVKQVRQPYLDPRKCVGCGACEYACPLQDRSAIYVTSIGESRSPANQILLEQGRGKPNGA